MNDDLFRSYRQYKKQLSMGHLKINILQKIFLGCIFFVTIPLMFFSLSYKTKKNRTLYIFPFHNAEPMKTILEELKEIDNSEIIIYPKSLPIFPKILLIDFFLIFFKKPLWIVKNLDFLGALSLKISKYYGYKLKYNISNLLIFQEYSFYSSYLTRVFEYEEGKLYNLMHGIPGEEASYFRFTKCFVWGEYFKDFYIKNSAEPNQFKIVGSIYHSKLISYIHKPIEIKYDILYAMQGDMYSDNKYVKDTIKVLEILHKKYKLKIAVKLHPIYKSTIQIPEFFDLVNMLPYESILSSKIVVSHFSTMLMDAKILNRNVIAFISKDKIKLVGYLEKREIVFNKDMLQEQIFLFLKTKHCFLQKKIIYSADILKEIKNEF